MQSLKALTKPSFLWQDAADALRRAIVTGEMAAGDRVSEARVAERLGVSRQPVRDAIRLLVQEGLLAQRDGFTTVVGCTEEDVRRLYRFREHLEAYAVRLIAAPELPPGAVDALWSAVSEMDRAWSARDAAAFVAADLAFHRALVSAAADRWVLSAWESLAPTLRTTMTVGNKMLPGAGRQGPSASGAGRHRHIAERILAGDTAGAEELLHSSLTGTRDRLATRLNSPSRREPEED